MRVSLPHLSSVHCRDTAAEATRLVLLLLLLTDIQATAAAASTCAASGAAAAAAIRWGTALQLVPLLLPHEGADHH